MPGELTPQPPHLPDQEQGLTHEQLVASIRGLIKEHQQIYAGLRSPQEREVLPPETIIRNVLDWYSDSSMEQDDMFFTLRSAWDALAYDQYEPGSREETLAGAVLQMRYSATREPTIRLTNPKQVLLLGAMAEAAGIPHQRGQTEITIPEKLRNYNRYLMSPEYQERLTRAKLGRNRPQNQ
jgi:hypothetical protein